MKEKGVVVGKRDGRREWEENTESGVYRKKRGRRVQRSKGEV